MATLVTQADLRTRVRQAIDHESGVASAYIDDAEIDALTDRYLSEMYDIMQTAWADEWAYVEASGATVASQEYVHIATALAVHGIELIIGNKRYPMHRAGPHGEGPRDMTPKPYTASTYITYRVAGLGTALTATDVAAQDHPGTHPTQVLLYPIPDAVYSLNFKLMPSYSGMGSFFGAPAVTTADDVHRYSWYAVHRAAAYLLGKQEEDPSFHMAEAERLKQHIINLRQTRSPQGRERMRDARTSRAYRGLRGRFA